MVFSSIPAYLDPANWQQQPNHQSGPSNGASTQFAPPPPPPPQHHGSGGAGSIRPGSMADRARMANIPMPEAAQKCPRCESSNTKFCYFNNYSLSQPRHFCKTCRRYWTRGGALRNVPVGGGCRRNKRSKESSSSNNKSPVNSSTEHHHRQTAASGNSTSTMSSTNSQVSDHIFGLGPQIPPLRFMTPFNHHLTDEFAGGADIELNYGSLSAPVVGGAANDHFNFHIGSALASGGTCAGGGVGSFLSSLSGLDQWRLQQAQQQVPFMDSTSSSPLGLYGIDASGYNGAGQVRPKISSSGFSQLAAAASVKMEESRHHHHHQQQLQQMNFSRQFMGTQGNDHYWNTTTGGGTAAAWTDLSSFSSSSTSNRL